MSSKYAINKSLNPQYFSTMILLLHNVCNISTLFQWAKTYLVAMNEDPDLFSFQESVSH